MKIAKLSFECKPLLFQVFNLRIGRTFSLSCTISKLGMKNFQTILSWLKKLVEPLCHTIRIRRIMSENYLMEFNDVKCFQILRLILVQFLSSFCPVFVQFLSNFCQVFVQFLSNFNSIFVQFLVNFGQLLSSFRPIFVQFSIFIQFFTFVQF